MSDQRADEALEISQLAVRRQKTEAVSRHLRQRLEQHLEVLRPAFDPRRLLGRYAGGAAGRLDAAGSDRAFTSLAERFTQVSSPPFSLQSELPPDAVAGIDPHLELHPWEYAHEVRGRREPRTVRVTSPLRWALSYTCGTTLPRLLRVFAGEEERRDADIRQFVVNALVMAAFIEKFPPLRQILTDLRFDVSIETLDGFGKLPLVSLASQLPSLRPSDELILAVTDFTGVAEFVEVIGADPLASLRDPLKAELQKVLDQSAA